MPQQTALYTAQGPHYAGSKAPATKLRCDTIWVDTSGSESTAMRMRSVGRRKDGQGSSRGLHFEDGRSGRSHDAEATHRVLAWSKKYSYSGTDCICDRSDSTRILVRGVPASRRLAPSLHRNCSVLARYSSPWCRDAGEFITSQRLAETFEGKEADPGLAHKAALLSAERGP